MAPADSFPDFHVSHISHLDSSIKKLMIFLSPSYIHMKPVRPVSFNNASQIKTLLCFSLSSCLFRFYHFTKSLLIHLSSSTLLLYLIPLLCEYVLSGHTTPQVTKKISVYLSLPTGLNRCSIQSSVSFRANLLSWLHSLKAVALHNSEGTIYTAEYVTLYHSGSGASWKHVNCGSVTLFSPVPASQNPFSKRPFGICIFGPSHLASLAHSLISVLLEIFLGFLNPFPLLWYHSNYSC